MRVGWQADKAFKSLRAFWKRHALASEIVLVLLIKLVVILMIKSFWFSEPVARAEAHEVVEQFFESRSVDE